MKVLFVLLLTVASAFGQGNTGTILGSVTDSTGAVIPGATLTIENVNTGVKTETSTSAVGSYVVRFLQPGQYRVEAQSEGFMRVLREDISVEMTREQRIDFELSLGQLTEVVEVTGAAPLLETDTGSQSTLIDNTLMVSLPLLGRNPQHLMRLAPGVVQVGGSTVTNGGVVRKDPYFLDGAHSSAHVWSGNPVNPSPDILQEFKVMTNSFAAEFGQTSGAIMAATTRSGTNEFHGRFFEYFRNDQLNAGNYFRHTRPVLRRNEYGLTVGGPIKRNQSFFFFAWEAKKQRGNAAFTNLTVPLAEFRNGDFSQLLGDQIGTDAGGSPVHARQIFDPATTQMVGDDPVRTPFPNNAIPLSRMSNAARTIQDLYPNPQSDAPFRNYNSFGGVGNNPWDYHIKIDHHFSGSDKLMVRWSEHDDLLLRPCAFPEPAGGGNIGQCAELTNPRYQAIVNHVHTFGPSATNDLHLSWWQVFPQRTVAGWGTVSTKSLGIQGMPDGDETKGTPEINFQNFRHLGSTWDTLFFELQNSYALVDVFSVIKGRHTIKFGGEVRKIRTDNLQPLPGNTRWWFENTFTDQRGFSGSGFDYASFLLGMPTRFDYRIFPGFFGSRGSVYGLFVQDDFRVTDKLTINLGLRWDAPLYYHEVKNRSGVFDLDRGEIRQYGKDGFRNTPWEQDWNNFAPRFGFAYNVRDKTVLRGGYGLFTVGTMSSGAFGFLEPQPIFADAAVGRYNTIDNITPRVSLDLVPYEPLDKTGRNAQRVSVYPDNNPTSYMQQWNFNIQQQVGSVMLEVGYAGSKGTALGYGGFNLNAIPLNLAPEARGRRIAPYVQYPQYPGGVNFRAWLGVSSYNSLQIKAEKRFADGLGFLAAYTWQKTISRGDEGYRDPINNRDLDRGVERNAVPQRFSLGFNYEPPLGRGHSRANSGPLSHIVGGWMLNGIWTLQGGFPMNPGLAQDSCICGSQRRPNVVGSPALSGSSQSLDRWFNVEAFEQPAQFTVGNAGRGLFYGPGLAVLDFTVLKRFNVSKLREGANFEFRGEFYNLTNTPRFRNPNITIGSANAGRVTSASGERQIQLVLKFNW
ncbi:MAG: TonB-dependent receptor [Bryobacterales bacterium]|nr:TonB-dependent receptor [Bryobacterales bacterium]